MSGDLDPAETRAWLADQVGQYAALAPRYWRYAEVLDQVLRLAVSEIAPQAIVQARCKSVTSFAEKCLRKQAGHPNPVHQFTDLCGARLIARTRSEVDELCRFIVGSFDIDWENSVIASQRLRPSEFGYRSVHYIVCFRTDMDYGVPVPDEVVGLKAEIQARTTTEHAYSDFVHDLTYKEAFELPVAWQRQLAGAAATLEEVDGVFARIEKGLREYASAYGRYLPEPELEAEIARLEMVLDYDPGNTGLAGRLARLAIAHGDWQRVVTVLSPLVAGPAKAPLPALRDLGVALCKLHSGSPDDPEYRAGQAYLERASEAGDVDALCAYAGTWKNIDDDRARDLYRRAFELDPTDPYALGNYLESQLAREPGLIDSVRPLLQQSAERCRHQVTAGINLPWALYDLGRFHLLLDQPYDALGYLAEALACSSAAWMVETYLASLERLTTPLGGRPGAEWARRLLLLALAARFGDTAALDRIQALATPTAAPLTGPAVIVAGGTDARIQARMKDYESLLRSALAGFAGVVISGGTIQGICGIVGQIGRERGDALRTVGYLPQLVPPDATADLRYTELRQTAGHGFSPLEPLQNWIDLLASGIPPPNVKVLGVNGGQIAAAEYRIALAVGATVGLVADSGREASRLLAEKRWERPRLVRLPADGETLRAFLTPPVQPLPEDIRLRVGQAIHESYRRDRRRSQPVIDPALGDWDQLPGDLQASNLAAADDIAAKLARIGCAVAGVDAPGETVTAFLDNEVELLAEAEHGRWTSERLLAGWTCGEEHDVENRRSPYLVDWSSLSEDIKKRDRAVVEAIPGLLASVGLGIRRRGRQPA
jgi:ppGpp synthetase/RelA/SpoT-type nucleotidyltranferase